MNKCSDRKFDYFFAAKKLVVSGIISALSICSITPAEANSPGPPNQPRIYHVSRNGDNTDGLTWATAWNEMDQIRWAEISPQRRDSLVIDGGAKRMVYKKPMIVQITPWYSPVNVTVSTEPSHNGQAVIAPGNAVNGIEISGGGFSLSGSKRSGILVYGAKNGLTVNTSAPYPFNIKNLEISHCTESGVTVQPAYYPIPLHQLILHDNAINLVSKQGYTPGGATLNKCWIYNTTYGNQADGIRCDGSTGGPPMPGITLNNCVLGPGLRDGINNLTSARPTLNNVLLINSVRNNISSYSVSMQKVTSFMTKMNPAENAHRCIKLQSTGMPYNQVSSIVNNSIIFGGTVEIPTTVQTPYPPYSQQFPITVDGNTQYRTTGNTTILASEMINPRFQSPVGLLPNQTPIPILMTLDFSLRPDSPAAGKGSDVTSIKQLLSTFD